MKPIRCSIALAVSFATLSCIARAALPPKLPGPTSRAAVNNPRLNEILTKNKKYPTFAAYREMADIYISLGRFAEAAACLRVQGAMYRQKKLVDAAIISETRAARYETEVRFFLDRPLSSGEMQTQFTRANLEPAVGAYIGAFIDRDDQLPTTWMDENFQTHRRPQEFVNAVGKQHASYFMYVSYGQKFPKQWLEDCKKAGAIPHIAWEPKKLLDVRDDAYLRDFAKQCGALNWPIFLRYASEMNGKWTPYNGNPFLYRDKFRLVHRVFKQLAPKVATVWCVNSVPREGIPDYYPGDDACDWVGINVYSVPFYDNNRNNPAFLDSPLALIDPIYQLFKDKKPMAICEYAASHMASVDHVSRTGFAIEKMNVLYSALPRLYPRIKMISWFNMNTMKHAQPGRQLNNYSLTEDKSVLNAYRSVISSPYFLSTSRLAGQLNYAVPYSVPRPIALGQNIFGQANLSIWVKSYIAQPKVYVQVGNQIIFADAYAGARGFTVDTSKLPNGIQRITAHIFDDKNRYITSASTTVNITKRKTRALLDPATLLQVSGIVQRFYADRSGLVTAVELQTPGETLFVHFPPERAQEVFDASPTGAAATFWVVGRANGRTRPGFSHWNLAGTGETKPAGEVALASESSDIDRIEAGVAGGESTTVRGQLTNVIAGENGEVVAIVLDGSTLVRLPREMRRASQTPAEAPKVLWSKNAEVEVSALPETARVGTLGNYKMRLVASTLSIGGRDLTGSGVPPLSREQATAIFGGDAVVDATEPGLVEAQNSGLKLYQLPDFTPKTRGPSAPKPAPLVSGNVRPW